MLLAAALVACGGGVDSGAPASASPSAAVLSGTVHGGQQPVSASQITAYAAGSGGFGSSAVALACVHTDANGNFNFGSSSSGACSGSTLPTTFTCPSASCTAASQIYLIAAGGNPGLGAGTNNTALMLMAVLGPYSSLPSTAQVDITELTTAAGTYALAQMMGAVNASCVDCASPLAARLAQAQFISAKSPWLDHAVSRANTLVNFSNSAPGAALPAPASCTGGSSDPVNCGAEEKLNTLADAMAACVNSSGPSSSGCAQLFCVATPGASFSGAACTPPAGGAIPANTLQSALAIALDPGTVPANGIFSLVAATPPFAPVLAAAPTDWTLALNFTGGGLNGPQGVAIDAGGNVWVANNSSGANSVTELSSSGAALSPSAGYTGGGLTRPYGIAIDANDRVWVTNSTGHSVTELRSDGAVLSPSTGYTGGGLGSPNSIAIDANGDVWVTNYASGGSSGSSVTKLSSSGTALSPSTGYTGGGLNASYGSAIDASGNVWVANFGNNSVTELSSSGAPLSPASGYTGGGVNAPLGITIDAEGNVWIVNYLNGVSELSSSGVPLTPSTGYTGGGLNSSQNIVIDGGGNVWVTNFSNSVTELNSSGAPLSPSTGYTGGGLNGGPVYIAIDSGGNVWVTNNTGNSVTELIGAAAPKKTPFIGPPQSP